MLAPVDMAKTCIALIDREARNARRGKPARIIVKVNAVVDPPIISGVVPRFARRCRDRSDC